MQPALYSVVNLRLVDASKHADIGLPHSSDAGCLVLHTATQCNLRLCGVHAVCTGYCMHSFAPYVQMLQL